jgi:hypothetical protein
MIMYVRRLLLRRFGPIFLSIWACIFIPTSDCQIVGGKSITIRGKIFSKHATYPATELRVILETYDTQPISVGVTDASGIFYLPNVLPGHYLLTVSYIKRLLAKYEINIDPSAGRYTVDPDDPHNIYWDLPPIELQATSYRDIQ